ncbi:Heterokaryon incompatibility protein (HET) domain containing protein [Rhypophila sp. PSN 637]
MHERGLWSQGTDLSSSTTAIDVAKLPPFDTCSVSTSTTRRSSPEYIQLKTMKPLHTPTEFRLVYFLPDQDETAPLEIALHHFDLDKDAPPYDVLLYNWGNPGDGQTVLSDALKAIRSRKSGLRYIWVDSICINQENTDEKNSQFQLMSRITKTAETGILWMGADDEHTPAVFELMERLIGARKPLTVPTPRLAPKLLSLSVVDKYRRALPRLPLEQWQWLDDFFDRPANLFSRYFILPWGALCDGLEAYAHLSDANNIRSPVVCTMLDLYTLRAETDAGMTVSWGRLLEVVRPLSAIDPRNKVFASVAWLEEGICGIAESQAPMPRDYTADTLATYRNTAKFLITQSPNEPFLSALSMKEDDVVTNPAEATLSWVPDWREPHTVYRLNSDANLFSASGCTSPSYVISSRTMKLHLRGCIIDEVAAVGPYMPPRRPHDKFNLRGANNIIFGESYEWAESRAQISGKERNELILHWNETIQAVGRHIPSYLAVEIEDSPGLLELAKRWLDYLEIEGEEETENLRQFYANCLPAHGRRFGITRRGEFCLLPKNTVIGGSICIPYGSKVPFVFRKEMDYKNIGECYIHGAMMGEAMDWDGVLQVQIQLV